jgi:hypothetical protein
LASFRSIAAQIITVGLFCSVVASATVRAQANNSVEYKRAIESAVFEFEAGNWAEARALFEQAHALRPSARTLRGMGKVSFELKDYVRAQRQLNASLVELRAPLSEEQRQEVLALLSRCEKFIGRLTVHVKPEGIEANMTLDGAPVQGELKLDLGQHDLSIQAPGYRSLTRTISIEGGKHERLELTLTPVEPAPRAADSVQPDVSPQQAALNATSFSEQATPTPSDRSSSGVFDKWWFWTIVGAVVVGGTVTAIALSSSPGTQAPLPGNTGVTVEALTWSP